MAKVDQLLLPVNTLIASLPRADRERVTDACEAVDLPFGESLCKPGDVVRHVYFPVNSYISLITPAGASESLEVGMVGNEGVFGITVLLDVKTSALMGLIQGGGQALRMIARRFVRDVEASPPFRRILNRYLYVLTAQLAQTAACNRFHLLDARMARWLLMTQDRAHSDTFRLTHQLLAYMLGVRRAGVTEAAVRLQAKGLIHYVHGELTVLNRSGLEEVSCPCYQTGMNVYAKHLGKKRKHNHATANSHKVFVK
jgi:CRP-like cAMP-binding protein